MQIEIDDEKINKLAVSLKTSPEVLVRKLFEHATKFPLYAINEVQNRHTSLDDIFEIMIEKSELGYTFNHLIKKTMGNRRYKIEHCDYDPDNGIIMVEIYLTEDDESISDVYLQFGNHPLVLVNGYIENVKSDINFIELEEEISFKAEFFPVIEEAKDYDLDLELDDGILRYTLKIDFEGDDALQLPKLSDIEDVMTLVREIILSRLNSLV